MPKTFHNLKCKVYSSEKLTSKGVIRNRKLSLATPEKIQTALGKQEIMDYKSLNIGRGGEEIQTLTYILTFNSYNSQGNKEGWTIYLML